ncbi:sulfurtransferase [Aidingimonas halophila]|uniref:Thiosulfate/3-mercaptopyruvate sulfurtransferase n=1 Tax=Aidingimonas halophila TaxID=574349 RepID=A0A1H2QLJ8_9GAMM|nr:sulfurtransferase [Aidingimonas halophila]GHC20625.1 putative 3-mercaptopyruvate sulfurtransferase [Aidingimonas halophila]SDW07768.1 thiosulfate/3-mercaptopyruvate sulfurtransferase [Aidingimonas halophila]
MMDPLISVASLRARLTRGEPLRILDCRARLGDPDAGKRLWQEGHIPGSMPVSLDHDLAAKPGKGGRHPLPSKDDFIAGMQRMGIEPAIPVVVYDDRGGQLAAARAWWMLSCWAGHPDVMVLDGGLPAWEAQGETLASENDERVSFPDRSHWHPRFDDQAVVTADDVLAGSSLTIDARSKERFRGETETVDPVAGHIPGAHCHPSQSNLSDDGHFKAAATLDADLPVAQHTIAYCGSGVTACHNILAYAIAGRELPRLYVGSWSHWIQDGARPVATGD